MRSANRPPRRGRAALFVERLVPIGFRRGRRAVRQSDAFSDDVSGNRWLSWSVAASDRPASSRATSGCCRG